MYFLIGFVYFSLSWMTKLRVLILCFFHFTNICIIYNVFPTCKLSKKKKEKKLASYLKT
jgi:hypothetical protein